ncbi:MAG: CBS domain-containing protein [Nitrospina sp.]|jgi:CBS domain-containing protein|nr:CBS domain-containing protein [Nitrospina sp.]MBT3510845.1 CBS domain-containing protein [Nitrospina sp.]MBT3875412.1 CBS domain-containing protein [Nitrospina sp.]MBT4047307.1 CBS domain-containing protein [Nitrospina sp.]MBT4557995.1 CBS domain-containing protein [Nitrospina sp.]
MSKVGQYMSTQLYSTSPDKYTYEAVDKMYDNKVSALFVEEGGEYVGIITKTDWMFLVLKGECDPKAVKISSVMTKIANTIDENQTIAEACTIIETKKIRHVPVTRNDKIVGMFSVKDLEKYYLQLHKKTDF